VRNIKKTPTRRRFQVRGFKVLLCFVFNRSTRQGGTLAQKRKPHAIRLAIPAVGALYLLEVPFQRWTIPP